MKKKDAYDAALQNVIDRAKILGLKKFKKFIYDDEGNIAGFEFKSPWERGKTVTICKADSKMKTCQSSMKMSYKRINQIL